LELIFILNYNTGDEKMYPQFPEFKDINIEDRKYLNERIWNYQPENSELTFTNLFIWKDHFKLKWSTIKNTPIFLITNGEPCFLEPAGILTLEDVKKIAFWLKDNHGSKVIFSRASRQFVSQLDGNFTINPQREHFDYVYRAENLIELDGRKYHSKRNHLSKFNKNYHYEYKDMTLDYARTSIELAQEWCHEKRCKDDMNLLDEFEATKLALENFDDLKLKGGVLIMDNKVEAFTLAEMLNERTVVIHVEKANKIFDGIYVAINNLFCKHNLKPGMFVNREQDLGDEGLKKAKLSYFPDHMVEKFSVSMITAH
jgi:hypothetical protein